MQVASAAIRERFAAFLMAAHPFGTDRARWDSSTGNRPARLLTTRSRIDCGRQPLGGTMNLADAMTSTLPPHVLAIDDDADMRQLIADYLGENELRVTTAATGADMD